MVLNIYLYKGRAMFKTNNSRGLTKIDFNKATNVQLLNSRVCDLGLKIKGSDLESPIKSLHKELEASGLRNLKLKTYLGDEWFSPEGTLSISIPFWLANKKLRSIEFDKMKSVEGGTAPWCMRLLRHEAGHCFDHAYEVSRTRRWQRLFGNPKAPYDPDNYRVDRNSRDFVSNLERGYAQSHPDEDFAETFAVCLNPKSNWRRRYCDRPKALAKLEYVDSLIKCYGGYLPVKSESSEMCSARKMTQTVNNYYSYRKKRTVTLY
jgi:hypothetical protein